MRAQKRDSNEKEIIHDLRYCGYKVMQLDKFDLLVYGRGTFWIMDVKSESGKPTASQLKMLDDGWPLHFVKTSEEALAIVRPKQPVRLMDRVLDMD